MRPKTDLEKVDPVSQKIGSISNASTMEGSIVIEVDEPVSVEYVFSQRPLLERLLIYAGVIYTVAGGAIIGPVSLHLPTLQYGVWLNLCWRFLPMSLIYLTCYIIK